jgi:hypothetical protein
VSSRAVNRGSSPSLRQDYPGLIIIVHENRAPSGAVIFQPGPGPRGCPTGQEPTGDRGVRLAVAKVDPANTVTPGHGSSVKGRDRIELFQETVYCACAQCNSKSKYTLPAEQSPRSLCTSLSSQPVTRFAVGRTENNISE